MGVVPEITREQLSVVMRRLGAKGGRRRAENLAPEERTRIARDAANVERNRLLDAIWRQSGQVPGDPREYIDRVWSRRIPKIYERLYAAAL